MRQTVCALMLPLVLGALPVAGEQPVVNNVLARDTGAGWRFDVTLTHPDTGWAHYADAWRVLDMEGNELGLRVLVHPHVSEQPFTRSLGGVDLERGTTRVIIQPRCLVDGWSEQTTTVTLP